MGGWVNSASCERDQKLLHIVCTLREPAMPIPTGFFRKPWLEIKKSHNVGYEKKKLKKVIILAMKKRNLLFLLCRGIVISKMFTELK